MDLCHFLPFCLLPNIVLTCVVIGVIIIIIIIIKDTFYVMICPKGLHGHVT